jgi:low affinity Fe/Cu permease
MQRLLTFLGTLTSRPSAFLLVLAFAAVWFVLDRATFDFHAVATIAVWLMTLLIQRAEHRDAQAMHAKLDELLHAQAGASNELTLMDEKEPEEIEQHRSAARSNDGTLEQT